MRFFAKRLVKNIWWILATGDSKGIGGLESLMESEKGFGKEFFRIFISEIRSYLVFTDRPEPDIIPKERTQDITGVKLLDIVLLGDMIHSVIHDGKTLPRKTPVEEMNLLPDKKILHLIESFDSWKEPWDFFAALEVLAERKIPAYFICPDIGTGK